MTCIVCDQPARPESNYCRDHWAIHGHARSLKLLAEDNRDLRRRVARLELCLGLLVALLALHMLVKVVL
jgi:hypothetical protein